MEKRLPMITIKILYALHEYLDMDKYYYSFKKEEKIMKIYLYVKNGLLYKQIWIHEDSSIVTKNENENIIEVGYSVFIDNFDLSKNIYNL